jgi:hypothetical protein
MNDSFEASVASLRDAERELDTTTRQAEEVRGRLVKARGKLGDLIAQIDRDMDGSDLDVAIAKAAKASAARQQLDAEVQVLERRLANLETLTTGARVRIAEAQHACHEAQLSFFASDYEARLRGFIDRNRTELIDLAKAAHKASVWDGISRLGLAYVQAREIGTTTTAVARQILPGVLYEFYAGAEIDLVAANKGAPPVEPMLSASLTREQQIRVRTLWHNGPPTHHQLHAAANHVEHEADPILDVRQASARIREFEDLILQNTILVAQIRDRLKDNPTDPALLSDLAEGEATVARQQGSLDNWRAQLGKATRIAA